MAISKLKAVAEVLDGMDETEEFVRFAERQSKGIEALTRTFRRDAEQIQRLLERAETTEDFAGVAKTLKSITGVERGINRDLAEMLERNRKAEQRLAKLRGRSDIDVDQVKTRLEESRRMILRFMQEFRAALDKIRELDRAVRDARRSVAKKIAVGAGIAALVLLTGGVVAHLASANGLVSEIRNAVAELSGRAQRTRDAAAREEAKQAGLNREFNNLLGEAARAVDSAFSDIKTRERLIPELVDGRVSFTQDDKAVITSASMSLMPGKVVLLPAGSKTRRAELEAMAGEKTDPIQFLKDVIALVGVVEQEAAFKFDDLEKKHGKKGKIDMKSTAARPEIVQLFKVTGSVGGRARIDITGLVQLTLKTEPF